MPSQSILLQTDNGKQIPNDSWTLAYWPDGSVKWKAVAGVVPSNTNSILLSLGKKTEKQKDVKPFLTENSDEIVINTIKSKLFIPKKGNIIIDSIVTGGVKSCGNVWLEANGKVLKPQKVSVEQSGKGLEIVSVSIDKNETAWKKALAEEKLSWPDRKSVV